MKDDRSSADVASQRELLSRRAFFRLNAALIAAAGTSSCTWRGEQVDTRRGLHLLRAEDLLSLRIEFSNLAIEHRYLKPARLVREIAGKATRITFIFPAQHIAEQAFTDGGASPQLPVMSFGAQPSRLSFEWPQTLQHIDLTSAQLLDWGAWRFLADRSTIAIPTGITLAPDSPVRWSHARRPVTHRGRSELWHTRLIANQDETGDPRVVIALASPQQCTTPTQPGFAPTPSIAERCALNGKQANIRTLMLSPMGGWLDLYGAWDSGDVRRWEHRVVAGQDQRVLVEGQEGFLFPFGHRASIITVTEREPADTLSASAQPRRAALLRQRRFIVVKQAHKDYAPGASAFKALQIREKVTPPLSGAGASGTPDSPFWVESGGAPFAFNFDASDWANHAAGFAANVVFVPGPDEAAAQLDLVNRAIQLYEAAGEQTRSDLAGQAVVVAPYQPTKLLDASRTEGDTTLHLLQLEHSGVAEPNADTPFAWHTKGMQARIPALTNNLTPEQNVGWFDYLSPEPGDDSNKGEIFAVGREASGLIAMRFSERADRSGGVVAPSIDVEGISRVFGPVGNVESVRTTGTFSPDSYFSSDAQMLGGFGLDKLGGEKSRLIPQLYFDIKREEYRDKKWHEETDADRSATKQFKTTVESGLKWEFPLPEFDISVGLIELSTQKVAKGGPALKIKTALSKSFGPAKKKNAAAQKTPRVDWSATAALTKFDLTLNTGLLGSLTLGFDSLSATVGSPKPKSGTAKSPSDQPPQPATDTTADEPGKQEDKAPALSKKIECKLNAISGTDALVMVVPLLVLAKKLSETVETDISYGYSSPPAPYPASVPSVADADASFNIGPVAMNDVTIGTFSVTDVSVNFGVGLYFFPRKVKGTASDYEVPGNMIVAGFGSAEKPLTVLQTPWGGVAHMAFSVDFARGLSGFQFGLGIACGTLFDFKLGKAKCLGSLSVIYTYINTAEKPDDNSVTLMLRIEGKAHIAGWIDVTLRISASGTAGKQGWVFEVTIKLQIKIAFFTVGVSLELRHVIANEQPKTLGADGYVSDMNETQWVQYQAAFANAEAA